MDKFYIHELLRIRKRRTTNQVTDDDNNESELFLLRRHITIIIYIMRRRRLELIYLLCMNGLMGRIVHQSFEIINIIVCECGCFAKRVNWDSNNN